MVKRKKGPKSTPLPLEPEFESPISDTSSIKEFVEIGGSPVPGLTLRNVLRGHNSPINHIAWSPDGKYLASPSDDKTIRIWDVSSGECLTILDEQKDYNHVSWSPDGSLFISGIHDGTINIWDSNSWRLIRTLVGHKEWINGIVFSSDGKKIVSASADSTLRIWDTNSGIEESSIHFTGIITNPIWFNNGKNLLVSQIRENRDKNASIHVVDTKTWKIIASYTQKPGLLCSDIYENTLAITVYDSHIEIMDTLTWKNKKRIEGHTGGVTGICFSGNGKILVSKSDDNTIRIWRCGDWNTLARLPEATWHIVPTHPCFHPTLPLLATFCEEGKAIRVWDINYEILVGKVSITKPVNYTTAKLVLVGDSGVGKTGLGWRLAHGEFKEHASTHGQQFWSIPELNLKRKDGTDCEAVLWDLAGQHVYRQVHSIFLENVAAALVLFDPTNRQEPLKGAQFWLEQLKGKGQLPPTVLVGARVDRGAPALSQDELNQFCQRYGIKGGYISTSARKGDGLTELLEILKVQIPWDDMTATVTTVTFKRIKDYVLSLKEKTDRKRVLVSPQDLRRQLELAQLNEDGRSKTEKVNISHLPSPAWEFSDAEMMTAVGHLDTHGYVTVLRNSEGEQIILLTPDLLVNLAASIMLLADKNPLELGSVSETDLLQGKYPFDELIGLEPYEAQTLLDAAILRFLEHNICFRDTFNDDTLLIFPSLIKQKRPLQDNLPAIDDITYVVRGRVENLYASLVVLLGYTPSFSRINQWQNQAQYEMGAEQVCGFRSIEEREGELELVLFYGDKMPQRGREQFQELFEHFLYQREVEVTRYPPVVCKRGHQQKRSTVIERVRDNRLFMFCDECGDKVLLPDLDKPQTIGIGGSPWLQREEAMARLRSFYAKQLTNIKSYRRGWATPHAFISHLPEQNLWAEKLIHDLRDAGVFIIERKEDIRPENFVIMLDTPAYRKAYMSTLPSLTDDAKVIRKRMQEGNKKILSLSCEGELNEHKFAECVPGNFCDETHYSVSLFNLVLELYAIPLDHKGFEPLRSSLHRQWEQTLAKYSTNQIVETIETREEFHKMIYQDFQVLITNDYKIRASSDQGDMWDELHLDLNKIRLTLKLIEKSQTDSDLLKGFGNELYQALFPNKINACWHAARASAEVSRNGVRLRIVCEPSELASLPWEFLYDETTNTFLTNDTQTVVSRYLDVPQIKRPLGANSSPLKILLVISSPADLLQLDVAGEEALIREALAAQISTGQIELDVLREATIPNLTQQLRKKSYNVFHFIGHGDFHNETGMIALVEPDGKMRLLDEEAFANLFLGDRDLGLVVLNSCRGATMSSYRTMAGIAPRLVQRGIPAVVAMQYPITDNTAKKFADEFYRFIALGWPVDAAIQSTRNAISIETGTGKPDFATPVLYMRAKDGVIMSRL